MPMSLLLVAPCHPFESCVEFLRPRRVAFVAVERCAERGGPPLRGCHPWPIHPRRVVTYVLLMAAFEFGDPLALVVLVVSGDASVHVRILTTSIGADTRSGRGAERRGQVAVTGFDEPHHARFNGSCRYPQSVP